MLGGTNEQASDKFLAGSLRHCHAARMVTSRSCCVRAEPSVQFEPASVHAEAPSLGLYPPRLSRQPRQAVHQARQRPADQLPLRKLIYLSAVLHRQEKRKIDRSV